MFAGSVCFHQRSQKAAHSSTRNAECVVLLRPQLLFIGCCLRQAALDYSDFGDGASYQQPQDVVPAGALSAFESASPTLRSRCGRRPGRARLCVASLPEQMVSAAYRRARCTAVGNSAVDVCACRAVALLDHSVHFYDADDALWEPLALSHQYQQNISEIQVQRSDSRLMRAHRFALLRSQWSPVGGHLLAAACEQGVCLWSFVSAAGEAASLHIEE
jgi:hypothetical protein